MPVRTVLRFALATLLLLSASAHAQLFRAYLASDGNDANPCTLAQPCRLLPAALAAVASGGEIWMLDSANYNTATVTIGKSVSILAVPGAVGSVVAAGGPAISIAAPSLTVALRNLVIVPLPGGGATQGVFISGASHLTIEHGLIANLPGYGVYVTGTGAVKIVDTTIRNNLGSAVRLENGATGTISRTQMRGNYAGVEAWSNVASGTTATVTDSFISGGTLGVAASPQTAGALVKVLVTRSRIEGCFYGLSSQTLNVGSALVTISNSMVTNNSYGWYQDGTGSVIKSLGTNHIEDNANAPVGSLTTTPLQ